jgi:hypothetical protein
VVCCIPRAAEEVNFELGEEAAQWNQIALAIARALEA